MDQVPPFWWGLWFNCIIGKDPPQQIEETTLPNKNIGPIFILGKILSQLFKNLFYRINT